MGSAKQGGGWRGWQRGSRWPGGGGGGDGGGGGRGREEDEHEEDGAAGVRMKSCVQ